MALGASASQVQFGVIARTMRLTSLGIFLGLVASYIVARAIASLLFGIDPTDPPAYVSMVVLLGLVALVAGYFPARRASRIDPMVALRSN